jgi:hypothetical protein
VHEVEPAGVQIAARRHAGQAADVVRVENDRPLGEAIEAWSSDSAPVQAKGQAIERIEQDEDDAHGRVSPTLRFSDKLGADDVQHQSNTLSNA